MKNLLLALALAAAFAMPAQAGPIDEMPYIKAWAYAQAIEQYCFGARPDERLKKAAVIQWNFSSKGISLHAIREASEAAAKHLAGDQSACQPALAFVERTVAALPDAEIDRLTATWQDRMAKAEARAKARFDAKALAEELNRQSLKDAY
jgi:hypothetical protein